MAEKKSVKQAKPKSNLKGRSIVETVTVPVVYEEQDALIENGIAYVAEELVSKAVSATKDSLLVHRYRMAVRRNKFNTIKRYGVLFFDTTAPLASSGTVRFKFKSVAQKKEVTQRKKKGAVNRDEIDEL